MSVELLKRYFSYDQKVRNRPIQKERRQKLNKATLNYDRIFISFK